MIETFCRAHILEAGGLDLYLDILIGKQEVGPMATPPSKEQLKVVKEAAHALLALLEDEPTKVQVSLRLHISASRGGKRHSVQLQARWFAVCSNSHHMQVAQRGAISSLISLCAQRSPDNDLRGIIFHCLASLSVNSLIKDEIVAEGALPVLCRAAKLRVVGIQVPVAAALANLCSSAGLIGAPASVEECLLALEALSPSANADVQVHQPGQSMPITLCQLLVTRDLLEALMTPLSLEN